MRFRKLRIAWSVICGIACVLLIVLWVRSYWVYDSVAYITTGTKGYGLVSARGGLTILDFDFQSQDVLDKLFKKSRWFARHVPTATASLPPVTARWGVANKKVPYPEIDVIFPHWFPVLLFATLTAAPWYRRIPHQFSIRTLLIATTLVAVVLGLITWSMR